MQVIQDKRVKLLEKADVAESYALFLLEISLMDKGRELSITCPGSQMKHERCFAVFIFNFSHFFIFWLN